jgi:hypothetical protein
MVRDKHYCSDVFIPTGTVCSPVRARRTHPVARMVHVQGGRLCAHSVLLAALWENTGTRLDKCIFWFYDQLGSAFVKYHKSGILFDCFYARFSSKRTNIYYQCKLQKVHLTNKY